MFVDYALHFLCATRRSWFTRVCFGAEDLPKIFPLCVEHDCHVSRRRVDLQKAQNGFEKAVGNGCVLSLGIGKQVGAKGKLEAIQQSMRIHQQQPSQQQSAVTGMLIAIVLFFVLFWLCDFLIGVSQYSRIDGQYAASTRCTVHHLLSSGLLPTVVALVETLRIANRRARYCDGKASGLFALVLAM